MGIQIIDIPFPKYQTPNKKSFGCQILNIKILAVIPGVFFDVIATQIFVLNCFKHLLEMIRKIFLNGTVLTYYLMVREKKHIYTNVI